MKVIDVAEAAGNLAKIIADVTNGEAIVLRDGAREVALSPHPTQDQEESPELEAEMLKTANGPFTPFTREELRGYAGKLIQECRSK
jgi:hypothetical protein